MNNGGIDHSPHAFDPASTVFRTSRPHIGRYTSNELLTAYVQRCGGHEVPLFGMAGAAEETNSKNRPAADELDEELADDEDEFEQENQEEEPLGVADAACFELFTQLGAREQADAVEWQDVQKGGKPLSPVDSDENAAQRLGCGTSAPPPALDDSLWKKVCQVPDASDASDARSASDASAPLTLHQVFESSRLGDGDLQSIDLLTPLLWKSLIHLQAPAFQHVLPKPESFRLGKKLNWHQQAERESAMLRRLQGVSAKRTSRAEAWRALSASLKKATDMENSCGDLCSGMIALFAPVGLKSWRIGLVLGVWRRTAKHKSKPVALPLPLDLVSSFRICEMNEVQGAVEGTFGCRASSPTSVCPEYRLGMVLNAQDSQRGIDGFRVRLGEKEMKIWKVAMEWTGWSSNPRASLRLNGKRKAQDEEVTILDSDEEMDQSKSKPKKKAAGSTFFARLG